VPGTQQDRRQRVVLLGASNLTAGFHIVLRAAAELLGAPLEVHAALGRGRSYGADSHFFLRRLGGIAGCGLWPTLESGDRRPAFALVTDVGNDLPFGAAPRTILGWIEQALDRLQAVEARTVITTLPLANVLRLPAWEFELWRRVMFPFHRIERTAVLEGAQEVDQGLRRLASARGLALVEPAPDWYGRDPIHIARARRASAWREVLAAWGPPSHGACLPRLPPTWTLAPAQRWILGVEGRRSQPCARLEDGTTLALW
jgi:hypothetical protein